MSAGLRAGTAGRHGQACVQASIGRALKVGTRPPASHDHLGRSGGTAGGPRAPPARVGLARSSGSPMAGVRARACTHGLPAGGTASRQNKHPPPWLPPHCCALRHDQFHESNPSEGWLSQSLGLLLPPGVGQSGSGPGAPGARPCADQLPGVPRALVNQGRARATGMQPLVRGGWQVSDAPALAPTP